MKPIVRLDKFLATAGYGTRKEIKKLVRGGSVAINNKVVTDSSAHVSIETDCVTVEGVAVGYREFIYLMLNKPAGYVSATEDRRDTTVLDLVPEQFQHFELFPAGRLDKDTEGFLLLTNDGKLAHELLAPKKHVPKKYFARIEGEVTANHAEMFSSGVTLEDGYQTKPAELIIISSGPLSEIDLIITEGKFHQVKRMFEAVGMKVLYLKRIAFGPLELDENLTLGELRELTEEEVNLLKHP